MSPFSLFLWFTEQTYHLYSCFLAWKAVSFSTHRTSVVSLDFKIISGVISFVTLHFIQGQISSHKVYLHSNAALYPTAFRTYPKFHLEMSFPEPCTTGSLKSKGFSLWRAGTWINFTTTSLLDDNEKPYLTWKADILSWGWHYREADGRPKWKQFVLWGAGRCWAPAADWLQMSSRGRSCYTKQTSSSEMASTGK